MRRVLVVTDPYLEPVLEGVVAFAQAQGWDLDTSMRRNGRFPMLAHHDGIIATIEHDETEAALARLECPVVQVLDIRPRPRIRYPLVVPDYVAMGRLGAEHLLTLGCPQVAFYRRFDAPDSNAVRDAFIATMTAAGRTVHALDFPQTYPGEPTHGPQARIPLAQWEEQLRRLLSWLPKPCAVMAEDDRCAKQLIRLAISVGIRVPEDLAVLGCDNQHPEVDLAAVPLSSVDTNLRGVGFAAARLLHQLLEGGAAPAQRVVVAPGVVMSRQSTASFTCRDQRISTVVQHIRNAFQEPLTVRLLARMVGMSVRSLQIAFKAVIGHALRDELIACRIAHAEHLLEHTDLKLQAVAVECGLGSAKALTRFFRQRHRQTPQVYRFAIRARRRASS